MYLVSGNIQNPVHGKLSVHATYLNVIFLQETWSAVTATCRTPGFSYSSVSINWLRYNKHRNCDGNIFI